MSDSTNQANEPRDYDVAVVGGGSGGFAAARGAAAAGLKTAVIEGGEQVGGLCILRGCMPTKALLYAAEVMHLARHASTWGIHPSGIEFDFKKVMERKNTLIREFADYRVEQLTQGKFDFIRARATFQDPHTLALSNGQSLTARHVVIATGSKVASPPLASLKEVGFLDSDSALELDQLPSSIIVLGGGAVALEFAQFFARFGSRVTVIQRSPQVLKEFDEDAARALEQAMAKEGITLHTDTKLLEAGHESGRKVVRFQQGDQTHAAEAEEIFFGLGRTPHTKSLGLDAAGVKTDKGRILTNELMQTSAPHIYTVGDCTGPHEIVHIAIRQGEIAAHNIAHREQPQIMDYRLLISVVFTEPQVAQVGLTEKEARAQGMDVRTASYPFDDHGKSLIMEAKDGFVKLLADPATGEIVGGTCVGPLGGELIHEIVAAMGKRMTVHELAALPHYHPTLAEIWTYPAEELAESL